MKKKVIYLNTENTKYCVVELYKTLKEMQLAYKERCPHDKSHFKVLGVHQAYEKFKAPKNIPMPKEGDSRKYYEVNISKVKIAPETGTVFLNLKHCGAGVVSHELMHAVLWAYKHKKMKKQYPIIIKNLKEEELILRYHTLAVQEFYRWYWKIKDKI